MWHKQILTPKRDRLKKNKKKKKENLTSVSLRVNVVFLRGTLNETLAT